MKRLMSLFEVLLVEMGSMLSTCTTRDWETISRRFEDEGLSFLTITLPKFCEDFQSSLDQGFVDSGAFLPFKKQKSTRLPAFLQGFSSQVFEPTTGVLLDVPNPDAIRAVRQLTLFFSKINLPCTEYRERKAIREYIECEQDVKETEARLGDIDYHLFRRVSRILFGAELARCDQAVYDLYHSDYGERSLAHRIRPKHGPGATADRLTGNQKWYNTTWTERLEQIMPSGEMLLPSLAYEDLQESIDILEPGEERPVRVILVPKTLKTPRIIAIEPTAMQFAQQALATMLVEELELSSFSSMIGFSDQTPNQRMAQDGSFSKGLATLDLSSASDRVSNQLVIEMLKDFPHFSRAVQASRSTRADVPGYGVIPLAKFASMGSALTFPIEAMVFLTLTVMGICEASRIPLGSVSRKDVLRLRTSVRVYGDDIICPTDSVLSVISCLEAYGFKVAQHKSFWTGSFRESCGKEYFDGHDVSIVKCRQPLPSSRRNVEEVVSTVDLRNHLYKAGLWKTAAHLDEMLTKPSILGVRYPIVAPTSSVLGRHSVLSWKAEAGDLNLHAPLVKGYTIHAPLPLNPVDGEAALLKYLLKRGHEPFDSRHLERSGRPDAVHLKLRWRSPF